MIFIGMNSSQLTPKQIEKLSRTISKTEHWLDILCGRMHQKHFPFDDPLKVAGEKAHAAVKELLIVIKK